MSMVERLAKRSGDALYSQWGGFDKYAEAYEDNARWWLNAIADELEASNFLIVRRVGTDYLREQAQEGS